MSPRRPTPAWRLTAAALAAAVLAAGCSQAPAPRRVDIRLTNFGYRPARVEVRPGDTLRFENTDAVPHTATADAGGWDTGEIKAGATGVVVVPAGTPADTTVCIIRP